MCLLLNISNLNSSPAAPLRSDPSRPLCVPKKSFYLRLGRATRSNFTVRARFKLLSFLAGAALTTATSAHAQNLLLNGDFETGPHNALSSIPNWMTSGIVRTAMQGSTSGDYSAALSISGDSENNVLSQSFATTNGQAYMVEFDSGIFGIREGDPLRLNVQALGGGNTLLNKTITPPDAGTFDVGSVIFQHYRFTFIATGSTSTIQFTNLGLGNGGADVEVDTVSVQATAVPPPTTLPLANADFELAPYNTNGTVSGWSVTGGAHVAVLPEGATSGNNSASLSPGGSFEDDVLSQRFFTTVGQRYMVDFDSAIYGIMNAFAVLHIRVLGTSAVLDEVVNPPYFATFNPNAIHFQHYHFVFTADSSVSTLEFSDFGLGNENSDIVIDTVAVAVAPAPPSFANWQSGHFSSAQLNDPQVSGWTADPDHDRIPNGLEFFFNADPLAGIPVVDAPKLPQTAIETLGGSRYITYTYRRLVGWGGNPAIVGVSDNLSTWDDSGNQIEQVNVTPSGDGVTEIVKIRLTTALGPGAPQRKFFRLSLTQ